MVDLGPYDISRINTTISHFPPINHFKYEVSYDLLSTSLSLYLFDPKRIYSINDLQQVDFQMYSYSSSFFIFIVVLINLFLMQRI